MDHLGLVEAVDGFGESIVIGISDAADRRLDACFSQALGVLNGYVLGGFKWSSQQLRVGGCDDQAEAALRSRWTGAIALAGPASGRGARRTGTVLGVDCSGLIERGCCGCRQCTASDRRAMVPECRRHATSDVRAIGQATIRPISLFC